MATPSWNRCFLCSGSLSTKSNDGTNRNPKKQSASVLWQNAGHKILFQYLLNDFQETSALYRDIVAFANWKEGNASRTTIGPSSAVKVCNICEHLSKSVRDLHAQLEVIQMKLIDKVNGMKQVVINNSRLYGTNLKVKEDLEAFEKHVDSQEKLNLMSGPVTAQITKKRKLLELLHNFQTHIFENGTPVQKYPLVYLERYTGSSAIQGSTINRGINAPSKGQAPYVKEEPTEFPLGVDATEESDFIPDGDRLETDYSELAAFEDDADWGDTEAFKEEENGDKISIHSPELPSSSRRKRRERKTQQEEETARCLLRRSSRTSQKMETVKVEENEVRSMPQSVTLTEAQKIAAEMKLERNRAADDKRRETLQTLQHLKDPPKIPSGKRRKWPQKTRYSCQECSFQCGKTPNMEQHLRTHETPEKTLKCPDCNKEFSQKQYWDFHIYVYCGATTWKCDICHESLHGGKLKEHYENFHDGKLFTCDFCDFCCGTYKEYLSHTGVNHPHSGVTFHCTFCPPELSSKVYNRVDILRHLHEAHNQIDNAFVCEHPNCSKVYYNLPGFIMHKEKHDPIPTVYSCSSCEKTYSNEKDLKAHILCVHKKEGPYKCNTCAEVFMSKESLMSHKRQKHGLGKLKCELCPDREYSYSSSLKKHMRTAHLLIGRHKMVTCEICGKAFVSAYRLKRHKPVHLEVKNFTCEICGFATKSIDWLKKHKIARHDGVKKHACAHCGKRFLIPAHLKEHMNTHTKEKPFQCEACGQAFNQRGALLVHRKKMHMYQTSRTDAANISSNNLKSPSSEATSASHPISDTS